jgi:hypothetical protein
MDIRLRATEEIEMNETTATVLLWALTDINSATLRQAAQNGTSALEAEASRTLRRAASETAAYWVAADVLHTTKRYNSIAWSVIRDHLATTDRFDDFYEDHEYVVQLAA